MGKPKKRPITQEEFTAAFADVVNEMTPEQLLSIPGVYEVVSEDPSVYNEAIKRAESRREEKPDG